VRTLTESDVQSRLEPAHLISALELAFRERYPALRIPPRTHIPIAGGVLLTMPCYDPATDILEMKVVAVRNGIHATCFLLDPATGRPRLTIEANYLTDLRTAATSALATKFLARGDARTLGIFGTGRQARAHLSVLPLVRPFERALVCGVDPRQTEHFMASCSLNLDLQAATADQCAAQSDVICTCTTSVAPLFDGSALRPGTHLNLVGAYQPETREVDSLAIQRARVFVDTFDGALAEAGDLLIPMKEGILQHHDIIADLYHLVSHQAPGRISETDITVFKSVGCALEDLVAAELLL